MTTINETFLKIVYFILKYILRNKKVTLQLVKASLLLSDFEEIMVSEKFFERPRYDLSLAFIADIKNTIKNAQIYLKQSSFTFEGWMVRIGDIKLHSLISQTDLINEYACAILFTMLSEEELQKLYNMLLHDAPASKQRIISLLLAFKDDKDWEADIKKVVKTTVDYMLNAIAAHLSK